MEAKSTILSDGQAHDQDQKSKVSEINSMQMGFRLRTRNKNKYASSKYHSND